MAAAKLARRAWWPSPWPCTATPMLQRRNTNGPAAGRLARVANAAPSSPLQILEISHPVNAALSNPLQILEISHPVYDPSSPSRMSTGTTGYRQFGACEAWSTC
jgi:hypothetical protein